MNNQSEEYTNSEKSLEELREEIEQDFSDNEFKELAIRNVLKKRPSLRKTYLSIVLINPARVGEIMERTFIQRKTQYNNLYELLKINLVKKISVMDLTQKEIKNEKLNKEEIKIMSKFKNWTSNMNAGMRRNFQAKTCYWCLSDMGSNPNIVDFALIMEKKMRAGESE